MSKRIAVMSVNWLGDAIMAMPALQQLRKNQPDAELLVMTRSGLVELWEGHQAVDRVLTYDRGWSGMRTGVDALRAAAVDIMYLLPNSFRTALIPWRAGVPLRVGTGACGRAWMLTHTVQFSDAARTGHQAHEMAELLESPFPGGEVPEINWSVPPQAAESLKAMVGGLSEAPVALIPGAARGVSKQWPEEHFSEVARVVLDEWELPVWLLGTPEDRELCHRINQRLTGRALNLCGETSIMQFAAALDGSRAVVANDSGGMHLATAVRTPVIGLFGLTDPSKTGPLGSRSRVVQHQPGGSRTIARDSEAARTALASITPNEVVNALNVLIR